MLLALPSDPTIRPILIGIPMMVITNKRNQAIYSTIIKLDFPVAFTVKHINNNLNTTYSRGRGIIPGCYKLWGRN